MSHAGENTRAIIELVLKSINLRGVMSDSQLKVVLSESFGLSDTRRFEVIELIQRSGIITVSVGADGGFTYSMIGYKKPERSFQSSEEARVYEEIEKAGAKGVSKLELKGRLKLNVKMVGKVLKGLEKDGHITAHKTKDKSRVIYTEASVVPEENIVGGNLYVNGEVDERLLSELRAKILAFLSAKARSTRKDLLSFASSCPEGQTLDDGEVELVLTSLVLDKLIVETSSGYSVAPSANLFTCVESRVPCFGCPIFRACKVDSIVSPVNCVYFNEW